MTCEKKKNKPNRKSNIFFFAFHLSNQCSARIQRMGFELSGIVSTQPWTQSNCFRVSVNIVMQNEHKNP